MSIEENKNIIVRIANGKLVEHGGEEDSVSLLQQLGVLKT